MCVCLCIYVYIIKDSRVTFYIACHIEAQCAISAEG